MATMAEVIAIDIEQADLDFLVSNVLRELDDGVLHAEWLVIPAAFRPDFDLYKAKLRYRTAKQLLEYNTFNNSSATDSLIHYLTKDDPKDDLSIIEKITKYCDYCLAALSNKVISVRKGFADTINISATSAINLFRQVRSIQKSLISTAAQFCPADIEHKKILQYKIFASLMKLNKILTKLSIGANSGYDIISRVPAHQAAPKRTYDLRCALNILFDQFISSEDLSIELLKKLIKGTVGTYTTEDWVKSLRAWLANHPDPKYSKAMHKFFDLFPAFDGYCYIHMHKRDLTVRETDLSKRPEPRAALTMITMFRQHMKLLPQIGLCTKPSTDLSSADKLAHLDQQTAEIMRRLDDPRLAPA